MTSVLITQCDEENCPVTTNNSSSPGWLSLTLTGYSTDGVFGALYLHYCPAHSSGKAPAGVVFPKPPEADPEDDAPPPKWKPLKTRLL